MSGPDGGYGEMVGGASIDLDALEQNFRHLKSLTNAKIAAIVKANGYGHGMAEVSRRLVEAGADYLGVAQLSEALSLRECEPDIPILTWLYAPGTDLTYAIRAKLDISIGAPWALDAVLEAARLLGQTARVHIEVDTGMSRGGFEPSRIAEAGAILARAEADGLVRVIGAWSHLARADEPDSSETGRQLAAYREALDVLEGTGVVPEIRHLANTAGLLWHPETHFDMVRPGVGLFGLSPNPNVETADELGLVPVMTLTSRIVATRKVPAGTGVSYGHTDITDRTTRLGTVPLGYADGIPRSASSLGPVTVVGIRTHVVGRVCMDQVVIELPDGVEVGDEVIFYGQGGASADEWADLAGTIGYEITTRLGRHVPRTYRGKVGH